MRLPNAYILPFVFVTFFFGCTAKNDSSNAADEMAEMHAEDSPVATGMAQEPAVAVDTEVVTYGTIDSKPLRGYFAEPSDAGVQPLPGIIMIHEWWGLNDNIETTARRLAGEGYRVLAVDLYDGGVAETPEAARELMSNALTQMDRMGTNLQAAYAYLNENAEAPRIGVIGWCFGGAQSLHAALKMPQQIDATVIYYGSLTNDREKLATLEMPILGFFGADDGSIPVESVNEFKNTLTDLGKSVDVTIYEGAGHAFANPSGQNYVAAAADDSWQKTLSFFSANLK
jgi:carboxymethylenebutenolidase